MWSFGKESPWAGVLAIGLMILWPVIPVALIVAFVWYVVRPTVKAAWRHPIIATVVVVTAASALWWGVSETYTAAVWLAVVTVVAGLVWRLRWPESFTRRITDPRRQRRRRDRLVKAWPGYMIGAGLAQARTEHRRNGHQRQVTTVPGLMGVDCGPHLDRLVVRPLPHQDLETWEKVAPALGLHLGAHRCRVVQHDPGHLRVELLRRDPLAMVVPPFPAPAPERINLAALPVGCREDGGLFTVCAGDGQHLFIGGETKAGKSSYVWAIIAQLAPLVELGLVRLWGIDPKCQEFTYGPELFYRLATMREPDRMASVLREAAGVLHDKAIALSGIARDFVPTVEHPLDVVFVDELAFLTAYYGTPQFRRSVAESCSVIASQGRTTGMWLVGATQDPGKDVNPFRALFPVRIALRLREATAVDMVLGSGSRAAGALCDHIPTTMRGTGYVLADGAPEPLRIRAAYHNDTSIRALAERYGSRQLTIVTDDEDQGDGLGGEAA